MFTTSEFPGRKFKTLEEYKELADERKDVVKYLNNIRKGSSKLEVKTVSIEKVEDNDGEESEKALAETSGA